MRRSNLHKERKKLRDNQKKTPKSRRRKQLRKKVLKIISIYLMLYWQRRRDTLYKQQANKTFTPNRLEKRISKTIHSINLQSHLEANNASCELVI